MIFCFSDLHYPRCTNGSESDCGSTAWALSLFISWNILSMVCASLKHICLSLTELCFQYIFANMFTGMFIFLPSLSVSSNILAGVVVENFSYVFQASGSGFSSISREQMRSFKKVWAEFSNQKTGYLERQQFSAFFSVRLQEHPQVVVVGY